jgi:hypothetical protein
MVDFGTRFLGTQNAPPYKKGIHNLKEISESNLVSYMN